VFGFAVGAVLFAVLALVRGARIEAAWSSLTSRAIAGISSDRVSKGAVAPLVAERET